MRTHWCGELRPEHVGQTVSVCGWVARRREHGEHLAFMDLRDREGVVQCVIDGSVDVRNEWVVRVTGVVRIRPEGTANPELATGEVELGECTVEVLNSAEPPPFPVGDRVDTDENIRLRHRYVDLRRDRMQRNLAPGRRPTAPSGGRWSRRLHRGRDAHAHRVDAEGCPRLRGARPPAPGSFYACPRAPAFKQLTMVGGIDRYFQIAAACATRTCAPTASSSSCSSTSRPASSARTRCSTSWPTPCAPAPRRWPVARSRTSPASRGSRRWSATAPTSPTCAWHGTGRAHEVFAATGFKAFTGQTVKGIGCRVRRAVPQEARRPDRQGQALGGQGPGGMRGRTRRSTARWQVPD